MKKISIQTGKVSTAFVILMSVALTAFVAAMIYISSLQTPREKFDAEQEKINKLTMIEEAQNLGIPVEEYIKTREKRSFDSKHIRKIEGAIVNKDDELLASLFNEIPDYDFAKYKPNLFKFVAIQKNENAFRYFLDQGVPCDYKSPLGENAFASLVQKPYEKYLNILIEFGCDIGIEQDPSKLQAAFARSDSPERILMYPLTDSNKDQYEFAFIQSIANGKTKVALEFIDRGVNINTIKSTKYGNLSALGLSVQKNLPEVAVRLIEKGADLIYKKDLKQARVLLLTVLQKKQLSVVKAILKRDPEIITREKLANNFLSSALQLHDIDPEFSIISLAFQNGVTPSDLSSNGAELLSSAVRSSNYKLVAKLLELGIEPNTPHRMRTVLGLAKQNKRPKGQEIVDLLLMNGATDDYLGVVRKERGIKDISGCKMGKEIKLTDIKSQFKNTPKRKLDRILRQKKGVCLASVAICVNDGNGSDDCVKSLKTCKTIIGSKSINKLSDDIEVCCSTEFKKNYKEARCSGLNVMESYKWIDTL